ncbi:histidinol-phosphate aminotransferase family protein, partial [Campylobacter upsaliensis]|nr:histidinol-phosphate aminotransferase family protein [Campylobacter upsaliensis]
MLPNKNIQKLKPYLSIPHKIWELEDENNILKLDWNEASIAPSPLVFQKIEIFLKSGHLNWYPNTRNSLLLDVLAKYTGQENSSFIELFPSSDVAHEFIIDTFVDKDENIGIIAPTYDNFRARANGVGVQTLFFHLDENYDLDFKALNAFIINEKIKLLYLCNPNNPTGKVYEIHKIYELIKNNPQCLFLIDEAYYEFCGKTMATFRVGYIISHYENIQHLNQIRNSKNIPMLSQIAALAALEDLTYMENYVKEVNLARA